MKQNKTTTKPDKSDLRETEFILVHSSRGVPSRAVEGGEGMAAGKGRHSNSSRRELVGHIASTLRNRQ